MAGLDDVRIHDLRHTFASLAVSQNLSLTIVGALGSSFEVDIISCLLPDKLVLADAKYYDTLQNGKAILGVNDVAKQINYETLLWKSAAFQKQYSGQGALMNMFIFPAETDQLLVKFCTVEFPILHERLLYGITLDTGQAFGRYVDRKPLSRDELLGVVTQF